MKKGDIYQHKHINKNVKVTRCNNKIVEYKDIETNKVETKHRQAFEVYFKKWS